MNQDIEGAVAEVMEEIDAHEFASADATRATSIAFYKGIMAECRTRIEAINADEGRDAGDDEEE